MTSRKYTSRSQQTTLTTTVTSGASIFPVLNAGALIPTGSVAGGVTFTVVIDPDTAIEEIIEITSYTVGNNNLTATRGVDGSSPQDHSAGAIVRHMIIGRDLREANTHIEATGSYNDGTGAHDLHGLDSTSGVVVGTTATQTLTYKTLTTPTIAGATLSGTVTSTATVTGGSITGATITGLSSAGMSTSSATPKDYVDAVLVLQTAQATAAATSAASAATSASSSATSAGAASTSAASAATSASSALTSASSAATTYTAYDVRYLGSKASAPTLNNQGGALIVGATYWNSVSNTMFAYSGSVWSAISTTGGATTAGTLAQFAATTSAELAGVISDETGSGALVFGTGPTISLPVVNNLKLGYTTTVSSVTAIVLTVASNNQQYITGTTAQVFTLPVASTMTLGMRFRLVNNSTAIATINSSGGNLVSTVPVNASVDVTCILTSGTTAASWDTDAITAATSDPTPTVLMLGGM